MEPKRAPRFKVSGLSVVYDTGEEFWIGPVLNASSSGLFIETHHSVPVGKHLTLVPTGIDDDRLPFEVKGVVARVEEIDLDGNWNRAPGIAFRFEGMSQDAEARLVAFLREHGQELK